MSPTRTALALVLLAGCRPDTGLTKYNNDPVATITSHADGDAVDEGYAFTLIGNVSDANDNAEDLRAAWYAGTRELCAEAPVASNGQTTCEATLALGESEVTLQARDPENALGEDSVTLSVEETGAPAAEILSPTVDGVYYADVPLSIEATVGDEEDLPGDLVLRWTDGSGAEIDLNVTPDDDGLVTDSLSLDAGDYTLVLDVTDTTGKTGSTSVEFTVGDANQAPTCTIVSPADGSSGEVGASLSFVAELSDPDVTPDQLTASWSSDLDGDLGGTPVGSDGLSTLTLETLSFGTHVMTVTGTDEVGATCTASILYTVGEPPEVEIDAPLSGDLYNEGETVTFLGMVSDSGTAPDLLDIQWESDLDGVIDVTGADAGGAVTFDTSLLSIGDHVITLTATDAEGLYTSASIDLVVNGLPSAPAVSISPAGPGTDDDLVATIDTASVDPEGDAIGYAYAWYVDGVATAYTTDTVPASATSRDEVWEVFVTPNDGWGDGAWASASVTVGNGAPSLADVTLAPDPAFEGDVLTCSPGSATDADGDAIAYAYAWTVDGVLVAATTDTLGDTWWDRDEVVVCTVTPSDGTTAGVAVSSNPVTISNSVPSLTDVTVSPDPAASTDVLVCSAAGFSDADDDADLTRYEWFVDGVSVGTGDTLSSGFAGGDTVTCTATPSDGTDDGTALSASVTIDNTPPVLADVTITPSSPTEADTLTCVPGATTDADGTTSFTYSYAWTVGGATIAATGSTLDPSDFARGDTIRCIVTPNDGVDDGAPVASSAVNILNTAPVASTVTLSPSAPDTDDTLTASATGTDVDGDAVSFTYTWYVNGSTVAATGATLSGASYFDRDDVVYVVATPTDGYDAGAGLASTAVTVVNSAPSLTSVSISPATAYAGNTLTCTGTGFSDADGDADASTYAWTVNGTVVGTGSTLSSGFSSGDAVVCTITPDDGTTAGTAVSSSTRTIANSAPVIASVSLTPTSAYESSTLTCTPGTTSDADGTTSFTYSYAWYVNGSANSQTSATLSGTYFSAGDTVYCRATASDGLAAGSAVSSNTVTISNTAPVISSVSLTPTTAYEASTLTCAPTATDADGDTISYTYTWYVEGAAVAATGSTLTGTYFASGDTVYCRATPSDGTASGTAVSSSTVTISNTAPVMASVALTPASPSVSSTLTCTPSATDADGDSLTYSYAWYVDSSLVAATSSTLTSSYFSSGSTIYCRATPSDGTTTGTAMSSSTVTVGNTAPVISSVSLTPTTAYESSTLTCSPTASDADGDTVSFTYAWYVNGSSVAATGSTLTGTYFSSGNTVYCRATPTDGTTAGTAVSSSTVTISNTLPVVSSVSLTPTTAYESSTLTCAPTATDADGDTISYTYAWYVNGSAVAATSSTLTGTYFSKGGTVYCRATPSDSSGSGTAVSSSTVTISNTAPVMSSVSLTPTSASESSTLTCTPSATDADGDSISYTYAWYVNSTAIAATSSTLTGTYFSAGNTVYCQATPSDGSTSGTAMSSSTVTISNTAPVVSSVSLTPTTAYEASTLTCTPTASDTDGDTLSYTYRWYVNGSLIAPTTSTLTGTYFSKTNTVYCNVTASDGTTSSSAVSSSTVTISNTAPVVSSVSLTPTTAYEGSTLSCTPTATDADGDSISYTYAWYVNSTAIAATSSTLTGTYFSKGNTVYCRATPTDGTTSGTAVSSSTVTIGNSAPSAPTVAVTPTDPEAGIDPIVCEIDTSSTDADGDALTYTFTWTKNGVSYTGATNTSTSSTVPASATSASQVWICSATASDGSASSSAGTDSVTVLSASYTIGYASVFATPGTGSTGANYSLCQSTTVSSAATIYALGNYLRLADTDSMRMAVYTSVGGVPTTLVAYTALTSVSSYSAGSFVELDVTTPTGISAGTYYICENISGTMYLGYTSVGASGNTIYYNALSSSSSWPTSWGTASTFTGQYLNLYMVVR